MMKILAITLKDLTRSFRSMFLLAFMFGIPLLMTGMFYLMFGSSAQDGGFSIGSTKVAVADLDKGSDQLPASLGEASLGKWLVKSLQSPDLASLLEVTTVSDAAAARKAVDGQQAGVALIIPENFSAAFVDSKGKAQLDLYQDPALTIGPAVVRAILNSYMDSFAGVKIAMNVVSSETTDATVIGQAAQEYGAALQAQAGTDALMTVRAPSAAKTQTPDFVGQIVGPIMAGMLVFFAFFSGSATAQTLLREDEEGTLPRLFTTPTPVSTILSGKFVPVFLTVLIQVFVLLEVSHLLFGIAWGSLAAMGLAGLGIVLSSATCGIFLVSLMKSTRQAGVVSGGFMSVAGMLGMMSIFTGQSTASGSLSSYLPLLVPQGWAIRGLQLASSGAGWNELGLNLLGLGVWSVLFFGIGLLRLQRRYA
jgi:ABC-2 type transport system permease protein